MRHIYRSKEPCRLTYNAVTVCRNSTSYASRWSGIRKAVETRPRIGSADDGDGHLFTARVLRTAKPATTARQVIGEATGQMGLRLESRLESRLELRLESAAKPVDTGDTAQVTAQVTVQVVVFSYAAAEGSVECSVESSGNTQYQIHDLLSGKADMTIGQAAQALGLSTRNIEKQVANLQQDGLLRRVGPRKSGHWEVLRGGGTK